MASDASIRSLDYILQLPLLQGMSRREVFQLAEKVALHFQKHARTAVITRQGTRCEELYLLIEGTVSCRRESDDHTYAVSEQISAPYVFEPENLFGMHTRYAHTIEAQTDVQMLVVGKQAVREVMFDFPTFRVNLLNALCFQVQRRDYELWKNKRLELEAKLIDFMLARCIRPAGHKDLQIKMSRLSQELGTTRLNISRLLNGLRECGLIETHREHIVIPRLEALVNR